MSAIAEESPLAEQLKSAIQSKALEAGWTQDDDDTSLAEYIVLMVANNKTQEQIASELAGDLLQEAEGAEEFAAWLMGYVAKLTGQAPQEEEAAAQQIQEEPPIPAAYEENDLGDNAPDNAPRGPKSLHGGPRSSRGGRGDSRARGGAFDSALHKTRGNDRIGGRGTPKGPRGDMKNSRGGGLQKAMNSTNGAQQMANMMQQAAQNGRFPPMPPTELMAMMEQQARMFAQFMPNMMQSMNGSQPANGQQQNGRSMFDRVERGRGGTRGRGGRGGAQNGRKPNEMPADGTDTTGTGEDSAMDTTESDATTQQNPISATPQLGFTRDPATTLCYFKSRCQNPQCTYAHPSPSCNPNILPPSMDMATPCTFGAACKNPKCSLRHPSAALVTQHKSQQECKFWPNCTNLQCPFIHPTAPICNYGASCTNTACPFTHLKTKCKYNPCTNAKCPYLHEPGQNKSMANYTWTKELGNLGEAQRKEQEANAKLQEGGQTYNRRFVEDGGEEELIKPENGGENGGQEEMTAEAEVS